MQFSVGFTAGFITRFRHITSLQVSYSVAGFLAGFIAGSRLGFREKAMGVFKAFKLSTSG